MPNLMEFYNKNFFSVKYTLLIGLGVARLHTMTDPALSCPRPLLKTTPPPPVYPWVSGGPYVTPEPRNRGLVLNHQLLKEPEPKNHSKRAKFDQKSSFWVVF